MSALIFFTTPTEIILAMDTLAVRGENGTPHLFTTKFYPVPHLRGAICGTGIGQFIIDWFVSVNTNMVVDDIPNLDYHTPAALRDLWATRYKDFPVTSTSTIYHFGFGWATGQPCVYAYRSEKNFESESLPIGQLAVKPEGDVPDPFELPTDFEKIMTSQREKQRVKPLADRIYIGGEILVCRFTEEAMTISRAGAFPDRDEHRAIMFANVQRKADS